MDSALTIDEKDTAMTAFKSLPLPEGNITPEQLDQLEASFFDLLEKGHPGIHELDIPVTHTFTKNTYVREGVMPAGSLIIGHFHREAHFCVILKGRFALLNPDRTITEIAAPCAFYAGPGRKVGFMREDVLMQNIHTTNGWNKEMFDDVEQMEEFLYKRSDAFKKHRDFKIGQSAYSGMRALAGG